MATDGNTFKLCFSNISGHQHHLSWLVRTQVAEPTEEFLTQQVGEGGPKDLHFKYILSGDAGTAGLGITLSATRFSKRNGWIRKSNTSEAWHKVVNRLRNCLCCQSREQFPENSRFCCFLSLEQLPKKKKEKEYYSCPLGIPHCQKLHVVWVSPPLQSWHHTAQHPALTRRVSTCLPRDPALSAKTHLRSKAFSTIRAFVV